jgi:hypothetical protein
MSDEDLKDELERLRKENAALKKGTSSGIRMKVSEKGAVSIYGMGRFPVTLYKEQWLKLLDMSADIRAFIAANEAQLKRKDWMKCDHLFLYRQVWRLSSPHAAHSRTDVDRPDVCWLRHRSCCGFWPSADLKPIDYWIWYKPGARGVHVAVAIALLLVSKETLRQDQMQMILRAGHRDIEKTALFLELGGVACAEGQKVCNRRWRLE